ncbi:MAG TPA: DASS family sodium-coupled anion symporter [Pelomicrobium sp.]|nr:DASS family sodium-coupled anion symporter [Pelomicrobium sp.]
MESASDLPGSFSPRVRRVALLAGPALALLVYLVLPERYVDVSGSVAEFSPAGRATLAVTAWMALWWVTEAVPIVVTALVPIAVFPVLGIAGIGKATAPYASDVIYLFFGGFVLAAAIQRWGLDRRIAYRTLALVGTHADRMIAGFMLATAVLSMWVSNTATTAMMVPIALAVINLVLKRRLGKTLDELGGIPTEDRADRNFALALLLSIAYSASIGGIGTIIGSPPNGILVRFFEQKYAQQISFADWMLIGLPVVVVFLPAAWLLLTKVIFRNGIGEIEGGREWVRQELKALGPLSRGERATLAVFGATVALWITRPLLAKIQVGGVAPFAGFSDAGIAVMAALALFMIPVDPARGIRAMDWETAKKLPWDVLILFGGGLSLAAAIEANGVGQLLGSVTQGWGGWPILAVVVAVAMLTTFSSELTSNTAQVATMLPLLAAIAPGLGVHPALLLVTCTLAASAAFMMPVGTPPNAIVFGTGLVTIPQMCKAGFWLNLAGVVIVTAVTFLVVAPLLVSGN